MATRHSEKSSSGEFKADLQTGEEGEEALSEYLRLNYNAEVVKVPWQTHKYDLIVTIKGKKFSVEVKTDLQFEGTGNIAVETECNGKQSGLRVSEATHWCFKLNNEFWSIPTEELKKLVAESRCEPFKTWKSHRDKNSPAIGWLLKVKIFQEHAKLL